MEISFVLVTLNVKVDIVWGFVFKLKLFFYFREHIIDGTMNQLAWHDDEDLGIRCGCEKGILLLVYIYGWRSYFLLEKNETTVQST